MNGRRVGYALRGFTDLDGDELTGRVVVEDAAGLVFIALGDGPVAEHERQDARAGS